MYEPKLGHVALNRFGKPSRMPTEIAEEMRKKEAKKRAAWEARKAAVVRKEQTC